MAANAFLRLLTPKFSDAKLDRACPKINQTIPMDVGEL